MGCYLRMTREQRYQIQSLVQSGRGVREIGRILNRSGSTICRELKRLPRTQPYDAEKAHLDYQKCRFRKPFKIKGSLRRYICNRLNRDWSPEQIVGRMKREKHPLRVSHQTIYNSLYRWAKWRDRHWKKLRTQRKKQWSRRNAKKNWKIGKIPNRIWIDDRPKIVELRKRFGDYERDTLHGKFNKTMLLSIVERKSRKVTLALIPKKTSYIVHFATVQALNGRRVYSITNDNGAEFREHELTSRELKTKVYFSHPYHSWERGTNENMNGFIRQYFPRRTDLTAVTKSQLQEVELKLNHRPRKCLAYKTPEEVYRTPR